MMGFEPTTLGTTNRCSNQLSYNHRVSFATLFCGIGGANILSFSETENLLEEIKTTFS
jgi:hypothetical protein